MIIGVGLRMGMIAQDLRAALNIFDPERALREDTLNAYFVARPESPRGDLAILLEDSETPQKILFTGHRGSGKSTELAKLVQGLGDHFFVVPFSITELSNLYDISYVDVLLSLGLELFKQVIDRRVRVSDDVLDTIRDFTRDISIESESGTTDKPEISGDINAGVFKLTAKLGAEDATRTRVREVVQHRMAELLEAINRLARALEQSIRKKILVIVEDLDKTDLETARKIFHDHAGSILAPGLSIIYTFPIALRRDNDFKQVEMNCSNVYVLPNIPVARRDGSPDEEGWNCCARFSPSVPRRISSGSVRSQSWPS